MNPRFLTIDQVLRIHGSQIRRFGGSSGVRDLGLLESALAQPRATFGGEYLHNDVFEMAAAYLFHLAANHAFIDGNKRTALVAAIVFLRGHGISIRQAREDLYELTMRAASGEASKENIAEIFRELSG